MTDAERADWLRRLAVAHGFPHVSIAPVGPVPRHDAFRDWLAADRCGDMDYLRRDADARRDPRQLLETAQTILCVAVPYWQPEPPAPGVRGRVARYAWGEDYHLVLKARLAALAEALAAALGRPVAYRVCVDSAPLLEREVAAQAGLGFFGKNTLLITPGVGSFTVLGELLLDIPAAPGEPAAPRCGQCRLCLDVCPTGALTDAYQIDARRCISYLTIEHRGDIPRPLRASMGAWVFGCDLCQDVCPFNAAVKPGDPALRPRASDSAEQRGAPSIELTLPLLAPLLQAGAAAYRRFVKRRALRRISRAQLLRNVAVALGNVGTPAEVPALVGALAEPVALIRRHVAWALGQVGARHEAARAPAQAALSAALAQESDAPTQEELTLALQTLALRPASLRVLA